ncbi:molybdopterin-dependent oxidoreductase [Halomonas cerina]|uniref:Oxidoreductase molybdopterin-binding domain-containing protein n=1 Tax=Halomonas cerina TaxID=447424 RepID=A0A839VA36_9GAMM|nr:molybdopterin-dependent oxidoreductase [Halomonas cerina]MBB3190309.1 hypothetical protein [Halomonas cerina]
MMFAPAIVTQLAWPWTRPAGWRLLLLLVLVGQPLAEAGAASPVLTLWKGLERQPLSLDAIERGGLQHVQIRHPEGLQGRFSGVWLDDFLAAHGLAKARRVRFVAHDGYTTFLTPAQRREKAYLLVTRLAGQPLDPDRLGPLMLVVPEDAEAVLAGLAPMTRWIWAIREIRSR